jgi:hypothetical protein
VWFRQIGQAPADGGGFSAFNFRRKLKSFLVQSLHVFFLPASAVENFGKSSISR